MKLYLAHAVDASVCTLSGNSIQTLLTVSDLFIFVMRVQTTVCYIWIILFGQPK